MSARTPWLNSRKPQPTARLRLFCFPYAGGSDAIFRSWPAGLSALVEVCPVKLPGRGARMMEPPFTELTPMVQAVSQALAPYLDKPFAFFGHSMGALIGFECARQVNKTYGLEPLHLFVSGRCSPQTVKATPIDERPDSEFLDLLRDYNGTPKEVLADSELLDLVLPVMRADLALCRSYVYMPAPAGKFPITAFGGLTDPHVSRNCLEGWREHTTGPFRLRMLPGDHFFLDMSRSLLLEAISKELESDYQREAMLK